MSLARIGRKVFINAMISARVDALMRRQQQRRMAQQRTRLVRAMYLHGSPPDQAGAFRRQLQWIRKHFNMIDFETFKRLSEAPRGDVMENDRPAVLLTFDDGLATNYEMAAPLLEEFGTRGVFFVVPKFSQCMGDEARDYYFKHISKSRQPWTPMTPEQIGDLAARGHAIGNHTFSHRRLSEVPASEYEREILHSADVVESWTGRPVEAFSWTFIWHAITPAAHKLICQRHRYCFSPCPGLTDVKVDLRQLIWRTHVEPDYSSAEYRFMYSGLTDRAWKPMRRKLVELLKK